MNSDASPHAEELIALCDRLLDGSLTTEERLRIETLVLEDEAMRRLYVEYLQLHAHLQQQSARLSEAPLASVMSSLAPAPAKPRPTQWRFPRGLWKAAAAFVLGLGVAGGSWFTLHRSASIAVLQEVEGARWESSTLPTEPGSPLPAGYLRLAEGLARLRFQDGAEVTLEGPAELEIIHRQLCRLHRGSLVAHVPDSAKGFTVLTKRATLIDHGTDFGISTDDEGRASVHVMKGEVELQHVTGGPSLRLLTQQMAAITPDELLPATALELEPRSLRDQESARRFSHEITTVSGRGAAAYVTSPGTEKHFSDTLLLLKNARVTTFLRKAILRFDLSSGKLPQPIQEARLTLQFEATGFGFAALGGAAHFGVYAVTDDGQDSWSSEKLEWSSLPAFDADPGRVDLTKAVKVGGFTMPRGILRGSFSIEGPELAERLRQDGNQLVTLIIVRENPLDQASGVVHGFAGNHHPSLPPPTLRLR